MARVFITGSSDGLGLMAARLLLEEGHMVVAHAHPAARSPESQDALTDYCAQLSGIPLPA
jgi:NAD(P)-dependent dehydrogenase (short-subunit alcohol dehydrogenase family)